MRSLLAPLLMITLTGCATRAVGQPDAAPKPIPLSEGVQAVIDTLDKLAKRSSEAPFHGLMPAEVEAVLQLSAASKDGGELSMKLPFLDIGGGWSGEATESMNNTIAITLRNIAFTKPDELIGFKTPNDLKATVEAVKENFDSATLTRGRQRWASFR